MGVASYSDGEISLKLSFFFHEKQESKSFSCHFNEHLRYEISNLLACEIKKLGYFTLGIVACSSWQSVKSVKETLV